MTTDELKLPRIQSPNRRSTPLLNAQNGDTLNVSLRHNTTSSFMNTPVPTLQIRQIKKRTKKQKEHLTSRVCRFEIDIDLTLKIIFFLFLENRFKNE